MLAIENCSYSVCLYISALCVFVANMFSTQTGMQLTPFYAPAPPALEKDRGQEKARIREICGFN